MCTTSNNKRTRSESIESEAADIKNEDESEILPLSLQELMTHDGSKSKGKTMWADNTFSQPGTLQEGFDEEAVYRSRIHGRRCLA